VNAVYQALDTTKSTRTKALRERLDVRGRRLTNAINLLEQAGAIRSTRKGFLSNGISPGDAVNAAIEVVEARERVDRSRVEMMRGYAESRHCRRQFLLTYFGQALPGPCGNCDRCRDGGQAGGEDTGGPSAIPINTAVAHREWGDGVVIGGDSDRVTVLFEDYGYRTLAMVAVTENDLLTTR